MTFTKEELNQYPLLSQIQVGMDVIALPDSDYNGLTGVITDILYGETRETENETIVDIVVDFNDEGPLEKTHPHLNGTGVGGVMMGEDELVFDLNNNGVFVSGKGQLYCEDCSELKTEVVQTSQSEHHWEWTGEKYEYNVSQNGSYKSFKGCGHEVYGAEQFLPTTPEFLTKPLTYTQLREMKDEDNNVEGIVLTSTTELIEGDRDQLLNTLSERLTGSTLLYDMDFKFLGQIDEENMMVEVSGNVTDILKQESVVAVTYVRVFSGGNILESKAKYNPESKLVFNIVILETETPVLNLVEEYILLSDGTKLEVEEEYGEYYTI